MHTHTHTHTLQLLPELKSDGHRVLIFSQFTSMLDLLETYLDMSAHSFLRIDGNVVSISSRHASTHDVHVHIFVLVFVHT